MDQESTASEFADPYAAPAQVLEATEASSDAPYQPFATIWLHPRRTVRQIVARDPQYLVIPLACLAGVGRVLDRASMRSMGDDAPTVAILAIAVVAGPLTGIIGLFIGSALIGFTGKWLGGKAPGEHIRTALAWGYVPSIAALVLWIPQLVLFGGDMFTTEMPRLEAQPYLLAPLLGIAALEITLGVWGFILVCNTLAEVQRFRSAWRGLLNLILAGAVIIVPLLAIAFGFIFVTQVA